ncbi:tyrosine-protein kinase [Chryseobacterium sp. Leaf394]|uniref:GumC family protein n=1 Tax=Chryseobacterium sp. Leaf394 TaxID=1736361 RepID=UPI0006F31BEB|nr:tyrosine-protein kinase [Chryseobacterium sp. Leaf394]KQS93231.1 capsular biosynthesis protein [Chryseobacterium sp. Leaf394]
MDQFNFDDQPQEEVLDLREQFRPYLSKWYWFVTGVIIALVAAWFFLRYSLPVFSTESTLLIKEVKKSTSGQPEMSVISEISGIGGMNSNSVSNEKQILKSANLMLSVVKELGLETNIYSQGKIKEVELYKDSAPFTVRVISEKRKGKYPAAPVFAKIKNDEIILESEGFKKNIKTGFNKALAMPFGVIMFQKNVNTDGSAFKSTHTFRLQFMSGMNRARSYSGALKVDVVEKETTVLKLSITNEVPDKSEDILNRLAVNYNREAVLDKNSEAQKTAEFIDGRVRLIGEELGRVESQKEDFKVKNNIADIGSEAELSLQTSAKTRQTQIDNEAQLEVVNSLLGYLNKQNSNQILPLNIGLNDSETSMNMGLYNQLITERSRLLESSTQLNPVVQDVTKQISDLRMSIIGSLNRTRSALQISRGAIQNEQNRLSGRISKVPFQEKMFRSIERQQTIKEELYLLLLQKREEAAISLAIAAPKARIVDYAFTAPIPVSPKKQITYLGALIVGLLIPFVIVYIIGLLNNKVRSTGDLDKLSHGKPLIGEIPSLQKGAPELVAFNDLSPMAEAFRILITNMSFMLPEKEGAKVMLVTSTVKGEGKTFISVNLALTLATPRKKVLIIGSDIRNPQLHRYNEGRKGLAGLAEYMYDKTVTTQEITHVSTFNPHCDVIYSGAVTPNPTDLLSNGRYKELLNSVKSQYDYIVLDTAPLMLVTDSFLIADVADITIYVARSGYTEKKLISFANTQIEKNKIKNVAFVLNDVDTSNTSYGYGYKYGYGYGATQKKSWKSWFKF